MIYQGRSLLPRLRVFQELYEVTQPPPVPVCQPFSSNERLIKLTEAMIDWRETERDGEPTVEFSFEGMDEMDPCSGRGWAAVKDGRLDGMIYFHRGDESGFQAQRK